MTTSVLGMENRVDKLISQLNEPPTKPVGTLEQEFGGMAQRGARARELAPQMMRESLKQEQKVGEDIMQQRTQSAEDIGNLAKRQAASTKLLEEEAIAARPEPIEFAPTQQTPEQLQTIAISMMLVGALAGGGAKRSGIAGLKAMTGMLDGYKQGRKDVFDREKIIFEKALETQKQKIEEVKAMYESAVRAKLAGDQAEYNSLQARIQAETDNGTMRYAFATRNTDQITKQLEAAEKGMAEGLKGMAELKKAEEDRKLKREELQIRRQERSDARADRAELSKQRFLLSLAEFDRKIDKDKDAAQKLGPTEKKELRGIENLRDELVQLQQIALANSEKFFGFGTDLAGNVVAQWREKALKDPEMSNFLRRFEAFQIPERHEKFGATLMGKEQESWRKSIIGPGNDPSAIPEYFTTKLQILDQARNRILSSVPSTSTLPTTEQRLSNAAQRAAGMGVNVGGIGTGVPRLPQQPQPQPQAIPAAAIDYLKRNPNAKADFDAKYGAGAADRYLSGEK